MSLRHAITFLWLHIDGGGVGVIVSGGHGWCGHSHLSWGCHVPVCHMLPESRDKKSPANECLQDTWGGVGVGGSGGPIYLACCTRRGCVVCRLCWFVARVLRIKKKASKCWFEYIVVITKAYSVSLHSFQLVCSPSRGPVIVAPEIATLS